MPATADLRVERCRRTLDFLRPVTDTTVAQKVPAALDELEAAYNRPADRAAALRRVLQGIRAESPGPDQTPFRRFLTVLIERRLNEAHRFQL